MSSARLSIGQCPFVRVEYILGCSLARHEVADKVSVGLLLTQFKGHLLVDASLLLGSEIDKFRSHTFVTVAYRYELQI